MNYWVIFLIFVPLGIFVFGRPIDAGYWEGANRIKIFVWDVLGIAGIQSYNITWWFNKLILILYILSPIVYIFTKQLPIFSILLLFFMQRFKVLGGTYSLDLYLMPFVLGFIWAQNAEYVQNKLHKIPKWIIVFGSFYLLVVTIYLRQRGTLIGNLEWDTYLAVAIALFIVLIRQLWSSNNHNKIASIITRTSIFAFLGKHSMNIYMIHTFVFYYFWHKEIYSLGNPWLILLVVTSISLGFSVVIEYIKDKIHFYKVPDIIINKYEQYKIKSK